jgi:thiamine-phosphate pyrophosphorylase
VTQSEAGCELYLVIETGEGSAARLSAALEAATIATVLIRAPKNSAPDAAAAKALVELAHRSGVPALIVGDPALVRSTAADGIHLTTGDLATYEAARSALGNARIIGVHPGVSRHDAMTAAEAGADYIAFGAPLHLNDRDKGRQRRDDLVAWWAEIFQVPCVAFDVDTRDEAEALARSGADFVAITLGAGLAAADARRHVTEIAAALLSVASEQETA